jgi:hypothetical protein
MTGVAMEQVALLWPRQQQQQQVLQGNVLVAVARRSLQASDSGAT